MFVITSKCTNFNNFLQISHKFIFGEMYLFAQNLSSWMLSCPGEHGRPVHVRGLENIKAPQIPGIRNFAVIIVKRDACSYVSEVFSWGNLKFVFRRTPVHVT